MRARQIRNRSPYILAKSGVPMILPSSGTVGNNGALSGITALPITFSGGCYMFFPAGSVYAGSPAGLYYVVMSSPTAGTIYANRYTGGVPTIPASPTPIVAAGPGAYTQATAADITLLSAAYAGGSLGLNGKIDFELMYSGPNNANNKTFKIGTSANVGYFVSISTSTSNSSARFSCSAVVSGIATSLTTSSYTNFNYQASNPFTGRTSGFDVGVDDSLRVSAQLAAAADYFILFASSICINP